MFITKIYLLLTLCLLGYESKSDKKIIDIDYVGHGIIQHTHEEWNCEFDLHRRFCEFKCKNVPGICIHTKCYCAKSVSRAQPIFVKPEELPPSDSSEELFQDGHPTNLNYEPKVPNSRPLRRHHIAHFCPNLDEARKCIRTCMVQGKAAFCGKDHVCYCGHSMGGWEMQSKDTENDARGLYAMFKDMYDKYFGKPKPEKLIIQKDINQDPDLNEDISKVTGGVIQNLDSSSDEIKVAN